jgi:hypothetical protein
MFAPITVNTKTFNQAGEGRYLNALTGFGQPADYFLIKGGSRSKSGNTVAAISRVTEKDVTVNGVTSRLSASLQLVATVPPNGFTSTEVDAMLLDISEFLTAATGNRWLSGES